MTAARKYERSDVYFNTLVLDRFFHTAEKDYIASRMLYCSGLRQLFIWQAGQTIEKYLKAAILLSGGSIRKSHSLTWHFDQLRQVCANQIPTAMLIDDNAYRYPIQVSEEGYEYEVNYTENTRDFVERINSIYDPEQRYNQRGFSIELYDLFKFDQLTCILRNIPLNRMDLHQDFPINNSAFGDVQLSKLNKCAVEFLKAANYPFFPENGWSPETIQLTWYAVSAGAGKNEFLMSDPDYRTAINRLEKRIKRK